MRSLRGKRLLILGGNMCKDEIRRYADEEGITLIAAGNRADAGFFEIADEKHVINNTDSEAMTHLIRKERIDGVYMGGNEKVIGAASRYLNDIGLACYCRPDTWKLLHDKNAFKRACCRHGLPVVRSYEYEDIIKGRYEDFKFPVITKPSDSCGSSGFSICSSPGELNAGYERAKVAAAGGEVVIEDFVRNNGVVVFYKLSQGKLHFCGMEDKYPVKFRDQDSYVAGLLIFESAFTEEFRNKYEAKLQGMLNDIRAEEGSLWIEIFCDGGNFYFNEAGYRYGGTGSIYPTNYISGINELAADMYYALTGESVLYGFEPLISPDLPRDKRYAVCCVYLNPGRIAEFEGLEKIEDRAEVVKLIRCKKAGDIVTQDASFDRIGAIVHFIFDKESELDSMLRYVNANISAKDAEGNEMIADLLQVENSELRI